MTIPDMSEDLLEKQLSGSVAVRDPSAHPTSPPRPPKAARPVFRLENDSAIRAIRETDPEPLKATIAVDAAKTSSGKIQSIEPIEPVANGRGTLPLVEPKRSTLSPLQRAALRGFKGKS